MAQIYYSQLTNYGADLINQHVLSGEPFIMQGWSIAAGTGALEPTPETTDLVNKIFDKTSEFYPGITYGTDENYGRFAQIVLPSTLEGNIITELGLYDANDKLVIACKCHEDLSAGIAEGIIATRVERISLSVIPESVEVIYVNESNYITRDEADEQFQKLSEKAQANGYAPLDEDAKVPQIHLPSQYTKFSINNGKMTDGVEDILNVSQSLQTFEYTEAGTYTINVLKTTTATVELVGGGGDFAYASWHTDRWYYNSCGGGSGAKITGDLILPQGTYTITVGANGQATSINDLLVAGAGGNASSGGYGSVGIGGTATISPSVQSISLETTNGNNGNATGSTIGYISSVYGGKSTYDDSYTGYGAGGGYSVVQSTGFNGYAKITLTSTSEDDNLISFNVSSANPITYTNANGESFTKNYLNQIDTTEYDDGVYNCFLNSTNQPYLLKNSIYYSKSQPTSMVEGDIWFNKNTKKAYKYTVDELVEFADVPCGKITIASGVITQVLQPIFNIDFTKTYIIKSYVNGSDGYDIYSPDENGNFKCVQRGFITKTTGMNVDIPCNLYKKMKDTQYQMFANPIFTASTDTTCHLHCVNTSTSVMTIVPHWGGTGMDINWQINGYLDRNEIGV